MAKNNKLSGRLDFYILKAVIYESTCFSWLESASGPKLYPCRGFDITLRLTTLNRTLLEKGSARR